MSFQIAREAQKTAGGYTIDLPNGECGPLDAFGLVVDKVAEHTSRSLALPESRFTFLPADGKLELASDHFAVCKHAIESVAAQIRGYQAVKLGANEILELLQLFGDDYEVITCLDGSVSFHFAGNHSDDVEQSEINARLLKIKEKFLAFGCEDLAGQVDTMLHNIRVATEVLSWRGAWT